MILKKYFSWCGVVVLGVCVVGSGVLFYWAEISQPKLGQTTVVPGLVSEVHIEQDAQGVPTLRASTLEDMYRAQGWVSARDRWFQMDLIRRRSAGRLAEIFGKRLLAFDQLHRTLGLEQVAQKAVAVMSPVLRAQFQAYVDGVNAFVVQGPKPFEMRVLSYDPEPWRVEDTLLVILSMFEDIDFVIQAATERSLTRLAKHRLPEVVDFLTPVMGFLDAPVVPDQGSLGVKIPPASLLDVRRETHELRVADIYGQPLPPPGSNGWAIAGKLTQSGKPILAGDPHLKLFAPTIWYRVSLQGAGLSVTGVSLPGIPGVVIGSNGDVAWTLTTAYGDGLDLVEVTPKTPLTTREEIISVRWGKDVPWTVKETPWGPVLFEDEEGVDYAIEWTALDPRELAQVTITEINQARDTHQLLQAFSRWKGPVQNLIYATRSGDIGWAEIGTLPKRQGFDGRFAMPRDEQHRWERYFRFDEMPKVINPPSGLIVSANQRSMSLGQKGTGDIRRFGNNWPSPTRAYRIRQRLEEKRRWTVEASYEVQLDIFSHQMVFYRDVLQSVLSQTPDTDPWFKVIRELITSWDGRVTTDSGAYPLLRIFHFQLISDLIDPLWGIPPFREAVSDVPVWPVFAWYYHEPVLLALLKHQPPHLLAPQFQNYAEAIRSAAKTAAQVLVKRPQDLRELRWGDFNHTEIHHVFSLSLPNFLGKYFRMRSAEFSGDHWVPKVGTMFYGLFHSASMRMVVDLADMRRGIFNHPGGQSGHFRSPHYRDQYEAWLSGTPTPFMPGASVVPDRLVPRVPEVASKN